MTQKKIFEKIRQSNDLPHLPQVMLKLIKACNTGQTSIDELTDIISTEPSLTSRLLQIIGSSYINLPKAVSSIKTAVVYLGIDTIRNMAISTSAMRFFNFSETIPEFNIGRFWGHSYKCGVIARKVAEENNFSNPDEFFLAGLLHDIGRLVLLQNFPDDYRAILLSNPTEKQTIVAEMALFDTDTPEVSAWLFNQWHLNPLMADAVRFINETVEQIESALTPVKVVFISNFLAEPTALGNLPDILSLTDISPSRLKHITIGAAQEVDEMAKSLGINMDGVQETTCETSLTSEIKDLSLFYGTLQNLLQAREIGAVLDVAENGFKIVFNVPRVFYFLLDEEKEMLTGYTSSKDKSHKIIKTIALPLSNTSSLLVKCLKEQTVQATLNQPTSSLPLAISDTQIIRLLEADGMYCVPLYSLEKASGVMVLGVDEKTAACLDDNDGVVNLFSKQTGACIQRLRFYNDLSLNIHEKKMEAYSTLTDKVIHEINNPLSIIKNYIETLSLKLPDKHPVQEDLSVIGEEMNRIAGLLDKLRQFSKPKIDGFEPVNINRLCQSILEILKKSILMPRQIETAINIDPEIPDIKTDPNGLKQVFINLVKNAAEALQAGGKISITTRFLSDSAKIMIDEKRRIPGSVEIVISDNGPGIDEKIKETLFEPYTTTKTGTANSGLGLSIVHSIVKELNGTITCRSKQGMGTRFIIILPVSSSKQR
ncbi:HDOD domain-containing protein [Desulfobacula sp.]|uniref:HDOD domain-containing protein n=1 Tax=Desulfobacula sp. TaxID=2593537 RepID=UPI0026392978|nr:HDOD domain-containing protein [Desulfobacula sp.]